MPRRGRSRSSDRSYDRYSSHSSDSRYDSDDDSRRSSSSESYSDVSSRHSGRGGVAPLRRSGRRPPRDFRCHVCSSEHHWTIDCPTVLRDPSRYRHMDTRRGCNRCGLPGHQWSVCPNRRYSCRECGDMHESAECPHSHEPLEYHEFFDEARQLNYYFCCKDKTISWVFRGSFKLDKLLWHCDRCQVLLPAKAVTACVLCGAERKRAPRPGKATTAPSTTNEDKAEGVAISA